MMRTCRECGQGPDDEITYGHQTMCSLYEGWWQEDVVKNPWDETLPDMKEDRLPPPIGVGICLVILLLCAATIGGCIGWIVLELVRGQ